MTKHLILIIFSVFIVENIYAQNINWNWGETNGAHFVHASIGYDFGTTTHLGYSYSDHIKKPVLFTLDYSMPMGKNTFDDYKLKVGGQVQLLEFKNFITSIKLFGVLNRHETKLVRIANLGTETSGLVGYYKSKWHIALEFGYLNPIMSNLQNSEILKTNYPLSKDGWYNSSGGHFFYGFQGSISLAKKVDLSLNIGVTNAKADHKDALLPYYTNIGVLTRI